MSRVTAILDEVFRISGRGTVVMLRDVAGPDIRIGDALQVGSFALQVEGIDLPRRTGDLSARIETGVWPMLGLWVSPDIKDDLLPLKGTTVSLQARSP